MEIHIITDPDEINDIVPVIRSAWGFDTLDGLVKDIVAAMRFHGGLVLGAYENSQMVGMSFGFPGFRNGKLYLYSHMTGVLEGKKYSGIGYGLKQYQFNWARDHNFDLVAWTFDPLMSLNANFNIRKLGGITRTYVSNFYGRMEDRINTGIRSDRVVAEKWINRSAAVTYSKEEIVFANRQDTGEALIDLANIHDGKPIAVHIPRNFNEIKEKSKEEAQVWKEIISRLLTGLFEKGYVAIDFVPEDFPYYVLIDNLDIPNNMAMNPFSRPL